MFLSCKGFLIDEAVLIAMEKWKQILWSLKPPVPVLWALNICSNLGLL